MPDEKRKLLAKKRVDPLRFAVSRIGENGAPNTPAGTIDFKVLHRKGNRALIAGAWLNPEGEHVTVVTINGFLLSDGDLKPGPGRPRSDEKHLAVFLAWAMKLGELRGKREEADRQVADSFGYSEGKKVRDLRKHDALAKKFSALGLDCGSSMLWVEDRSADGPPQCSLLIPKPTIYSTPSGGFEILGKTAVAWEPGMGPRVRVLSGVRLEADRFEQTPGGDSLDEAINNRRPLIISIIRPGR